MRAAFIPVTEEGMTVSSLLIWNVPVLMDKNITASSAVVELLGSMACS